MASAVNDALLAKSLPDPFSMADLRNSLHTRFLKSRCNAERKQSVECRIAYSLWFFPIIDSLPAFVSSSQKDIPACLWFNSALLTLFHGAAGKYSLSTFQNRPCQLLIVSLWSAGPWDCLPGDDPGLSTLSISWMLLTLVLPYGCPLFCMAGGDCTGPQKIPCRGMRKT